MSGKTELLFSNNRTVRLSDPGEEGAQSHLFETTYISFEALLDDNQVSYVFTRKVEDKIEQQQSFTDLKEFFKFAGDYLDPIALGLMGVKIGSLSAATK
ncbi:hypothetical protein EDC44_11130 [Cricetibacter osteomyelitidis]|uniref:Uncharacterized protein n=1 Tax=Cricetibacter osteomyelitidis TaxID=1521931 RepID=A0A4R2SZB1_9PAST|nr:DUF5377 family protein [Cricetibacter osteomyelitidis]TCP95080.1 hypothetical protein EDC44_11130 [Cricetibacter osteomyelitidis]